MSAIEDICNEWLLDLANDMRASIRDAVKHTGGESNLESSVTPNLKVLSNGNLVLTLSMADYWQYVDKGRGKTKSGGTGAVRRGVGKDWMAQKGINARTIMIEIYRKGGIKLPKRGLSYDKAARQLSFLIARKIHKEGFKARPFFDKVFNNERIKQLADKLAPVMKEEFIMELRK